MTRPQRLGIYRRGHCRNETWVQSAPNQTVFMKGDPWPTDLASAPSPHTNE